MQIQAYIHSCGKNIDIVGQLGLKYLVDIKDLGISVHVSDLLKRKIISYMLVVFAWLSMVNMLRNMVKQLFQNTSKRGSGMTLFVVVVVFCLFVVVFSCFLFCFVFCCFCRFVTIGHVEKVSMIRKYHNHTLQTNPRHREEAHQNIYK